MLANRVSASQAIDFLHLVQNLKTSKRTGWVRCNVKGPESIADHMYRMGLMSLISGAEAIVGDITPNCGISKQKKAELEADAIRDIQKMLGANTAVASEVRELFEEYEAGETPEAMLVKDFDKLEMILQASEYEAAQGLSLQEFFDSTAGRFKTKTGKAWAAEIVTRRTARIGGQTQQS
ncbi:g8054 [Coccomyxa viridis]|uniref:G8054 protein n=1 Tax=Coccomyxa viridis TaxID=1274662 RepID=A0ABP1G1W3_9CHLO